MYSSGSKVKIPLDPYQVGGKSAKRKSSTKSEAEKTQPIDENEQEEIISELRQDAERLSNKGRTAFHYLFLAISGIFTMCLFYAIAYPLEMDHQVLPSTFEFSSAAFSFSVAIWNADILWMSSIPPSQLL